MIGLSTEGSEGRLLTDKGPETTDSVLNDKKQHTSIHLIFCNTNHV